MRRKLHASFGGCLKKNGSKLRISRNQPRAEKPKMNIPTCSPKAVSASKQKGSSLLPPLPLFLLLLLQLLRITSPLMISKTLSRKLPTAPQAREALGTLAMRATTTKSASTNIPLLCGKACDRK